MSGIAALAYIPSSTTPQLPVASMVAPAQPALGMLQAGAVNATLADPSVQPDTRYQSGTASRADAGGTAAASASGFTLPGTPIAGGTISSFPSLFLAQLMAQDAGESAQQLVITYQKMIDFSQVKYKPSDAQLPAPPAPMMDFFKSLIAEQKTAPRQNAPVVVFNNDTPAPATQAAQVITAPAREVKETRETPKKAPVSAAAPAAAAYRASAQNTAKPELEALSG